MNYIEVFAFMQLLDFFTTLLGMRIGAAEGSPFVAWLMQTTDPVIGLALCKGLAVVWGAVCLLRQKPAAIRVANYFFAAVVLWNLHTMLVVSL